MRYDWAMACARWRLTWVLTAAGVVAAGAGAWCCGGGGTTRADSPANQASPESNGSAEVTAALVDPAVLGAAATPKDSAPAAQASDAACESGPVLLSIRVAPLGGGRPTRSTVIQEGGAFTDETEQGVTHGCLEEAEQAKVSAALAQADFTPPPPPQVQCMAVPTRETTVAHAPSGRSASFSSPCGKPAHPTIVDLVTLAWELTGHAGTDARQ